MAGKLSVEMTNALKYFDQGMQMVAAARKAKVTPRGLRYALSKRKSKKVLDRRK